MLTLSYGLEKPETNDKGAEVFPALERNIQKQNDHNHNGINSEKINSSNFEKTKQNILAINWVLVANGHYKQTVTLPGILQYDDVTLTFRLTTGELVHPTVKKASATQYEVHFDDNTLGLEALIN